MDEAISSLDFVFEFPQYIPADYARNGATVHTTNGKSAIDVEYHNDTAVENRFKLVVVKQLKPLIDVIHLADGFRWKEIQVQKRQAWFGISEYTDETSILFKTAGDIQYQILSPTLSKEEMIKVLESI